MSKRRATPGDFVILAGGEIGRVSGGLGDEVVNGHVLMNADGSLSSGAQFENRRPTLVVPQTIAIEFFDELKRRVLVATPLQGLGSDPGTIMEWVVNRVTVEGLVESSVATLPDLVGAFYVVATRRRMSREEMNILYFLVFGLMRP